jgi:hypothetical protein
MGSFCCQSDEKFFRNWKIKWVSIGFIGAFKNVVSFAILDLLNIYFLPADMQLWHQNSTSKHYSTEHFYGKDEIKARSNYYFSFRQIRKKKLISAISAISPKNIYICNSYRVGGIIFPLSKVVPFQNHSMLFNKNLLLI